MCEEIGEFPRRLYDGERASDEKKDEVSNSSCLDDHPSRLVIVLSCGKSIERSNSGCRVI